MFNKVELAMMKTVLIKTVAMSGLPEAIDSLLDQMQALSNVKEDQSISEAVRTMGWKTFATITTGLTILPLMKSLEPAQFIACASFAIKCKQNEEELLQGVNKAIEEEDEINRLLKGIENGRDENKDA